LSTLTKSEKLNAAQAGLQPADLAFLAMAQHQLVRKDEARATLGRLRGVMKKPQWLQKIMPQQDWTTNPEAMAFLREAEELIEGEAGDTSEQNEKPASQK
jgi:hypothetical protein